MSGYPEANQWAEDNTAVEPATYPTKVPDTHHCVVNLFEHRIVIGDMQVSTLRRMIAEAYRAGWMNGWFSDFDHTEEDDE